jgi:hypothetical protein
MARFASGDDQPREAMSWIGRWQTRKGSPKPGRRLKARRPRRSAVRLQAGCRCLIGFCRRDAADGDGLAKTGVAGSLGVMSRRLGPSAVRRAARGEAAASRLCVAPLRAVQGRRSALKTTYREGGENFHWPLSTHTANPRGEPNDGNKGADLALSRRGESLDDRTAKLEAAVRAQDALIGNARRSRQG